MKTLKFLSLLVLLSLSVFNATAAKTPLSFKLNIERVWMHLPGDYSIAYTTTNNVIEVERLVDSYYSSPEHSTNKFGEWLTSSGSRGTWRKSYGQPIQILIADVPRQSPMYIQATRGSDEITVEIHIHSSKEIGAADYPHWTGRNTEYRPTLEVE